MPKGKLIVIEGLDGSGKATQCELLYRKLGDSGKRVIKVSFPRYDNDSSALVRMYLKGEFGDDPHDVNAYAASAFFAVDRYASYMSDWKDAYNEGAIILTDRYTTSNAVYQTSKMPESEWKDFVEWLYDFEFSKLGIPAPDRVIMLDVSEKITQELMKKRYNGDMSKMDIDEKDPQYQQDSRRAALFCAELNDWIVIDCSGDEGLRKIEDIHAEITEKIGDLFE